jgi:zinc/manganese transport system substrate-binding protein
LNASGAREPAARRGTGRAGDALRLVDAVQRKFGCPRRASVPSIRRSRCHDKTKLMHRVCRYRGPPNFALPLIGALFVLLAAVLPARAKPLEIVAAENFYGDIARQIGGPDVAVTTILNNPDQDPHEFEAGPATARTLAAASIVVYNGADYDPWVAKLLAASPNPARHNIEVAALLHKKAGDNPHVWYAPAAATTLAQSLAAVLVKLDPDHAARYQRRLAAFEISMQRLADQIAELRRKYAGTPVTATEPVFGYMAEALGLDMQNRHFQLAIMNDTEPSPADLAAFAHDLRAKTVKLLIYNHQTDSILSRRMRELAEQSGVPVVEVTETEPPGEDYQAWMSSQLKALDRALAR